jgi:hypothetical protein
MTKYLDSKGLSYLWQKIKAELATKSDNHEHPYVKDTTVIKLGSTDTTGISLVKGTEGAKDSWTLPFATVETVTKEYDGQPITESHIKNGIVRSGDVTFSVPTSADTTWHKAPIVDGYVWYEDTLDNPNTVTSSVDLTNNKVVLGAGSKGIKVSTYEIGKESYTAPATFGGANLLATEAAVKEYVDDVAGGVTTGLQLSYTDGTETLAGKKVIKLTDTNNSDLSYELDATPFIKDGILESVQILQHYVVQMPDGTMESEWRTLDGDVVSDLISAPTPPELKPSADASAIYLYFVWKTVHHDPNNVDTVLEEKTATWLPASDLIKDCSADTTRGIDSDMNEDGGHKFYVKTTGIEAGKIANVSTGFDADGKVVGYVDLSAYQKSADLVAFDKDDMDAIFAAAEADLVKNGEPVFPTTDPLAGMEVPEFPSVQA